MDEGGWHEVDDPEEGAWKHGHVYTGMGAGKWGKSKL